MEAGDDTDKRGRIVAAAVGLVAFVVYVLTAYRSVPGGDSGELLGAVVSGGVIHPPGYPLYALLGALIVHLPLGGLAFRLNLLSATCDALAAALLTRTVAQRTRSLPAGALAGALFAFAPGIWRYAIAAEVFALNNLLVALLIAIAVRYEASKRPRDALVGAFVLGLGLADHQTILFTGVPIVVWALATGYRELLRPKRLLQLVMAGLLGLSPYLYLPIAAARHAYVSWGEADHWDGFWTHVLRREYGTFQLAPAGVGVDVSASEVFRAWLDHTVDQFSVVALVLAAVGVVVLVETARRKRVSLGLVMLVPPVLSVLVMSTLGNLPVGQPLYREIVARFWQQPDLYLAAYAGVGLAGLVEVVRSRAPTFVAATSWSSIVLAAGCAVWPLTTHYRDLDHHANHVVEDYGAEMLRAAPERGVLVTKGDLITNTIRALQLTRGARPDVRVVDQELIATAWGTPLFVKNATGVVFPGKRLSATPVRDGYPLRALFDANRASPLMLCGGLLPGDHSTESTYGLWPSGLCDDVHAGTEPVSMDDWLARSELAGPHIDFAGQQHPQGSWEEVVWSDTWEVRQARAAQILTVAGAKPGLQKYLPVAASILQRIVDENPDVPAHVHKNLAIALGRAGLTTPEQRAQAARAWEGYLRVAPPSDPQIPAIRKELERLTRGG